MRKTTLVITIIMIAAMMFGCTNPNQIQTPTDKPQTETPSKTPEKSYAESIKIKYNLEGMEEEREAFFRQSKNGYILYLMKDYTLDDSQEGKTRIVMDYDKDFYAEITVLSNDIDIDKQVIAIKEDLAQFGEVVEINPKEHFDPYFKDSKHYLLASKANKGSVVVILKEVEGNLVQYKLNMPLKEAAEGAGPALWAMLKTMQF